jgi:multiple sugar transport system substrate-binding protein
MVTLRGTTWDHPRGYDSVAGASAAWCRAHPTVRVDWSRRSLQAFADMRLGQLCREYDLLVIDHPHIPEAADESFLLPLDGTGRDDDLAALAARSVGPSYRSYGHGGRQWALPIDAAAQVAVHRPDLLPEPPHTWDEVLGLAERGRVLWPAKPIDALSSFTTVAASRGTPCAAGPDVFLARADGEAVLALLHRLAERVPAACLEENPIETAEHLAAADDWWYAPLAFGYVNYSRPGFRRRRLAYVDMPSGPHGPTGSCLGGAGIAVSAQTAHPREAMALAFWLAGPEAQCGSYFASGGQPAHRAAWEHPRLNAETHGFFAATLRTLDGAWLRPRFRGWLTVQDDGGPLINAALRGDLTDRECLDRLDALYRRVLDAS